MSKKKGPLTQIRNELQNIMTQVSQLGNQALNEASDLIKNDLIANTPQNTGKTANSWVNVNQYNLVKYIFNTNISPSGIPVVNLLEFGSKGKPFAIRTFGEDIADIEAKMINYMNKVSL